MNLADLETFSVEGMNIDQVSIAAEVLEASYGSGYRDAVRVGDVGGVAEFNLSAGVLPDDAAYGSLIDGLPRFQYYYEFWREHVLVNPCQPFLIEHRGSQSLCDFDPAERYSYETFTSDLFAGGVRVRQRRIRDVLTTDEGTVWDPREADDLVAWYAADHSASVGTSAEDLSENTFNLAAFIPVPLATNAGKAVWQFDGTLNPLATVTSITARQFFIVGCCANAAFDVALYQGLMSAPTTNGLLVGDLGGTKFVDLGYGGTHSYALNGTTYANNNMQAPMSGNLGLMEVTFSGGITLNGFQIGEDRDYGDRLWDGDIAEVLIFNDTSMSTADRLLVRRYLAKKYKITLA